MKKIIHKIIWAASISMLILMNSCSTDEFSDLTLIEQPKVDTIIVNSDVFVRNDSGSQTYRGVYAGCLDAELTGAGENNYQHFLAYGPDLILEEGEAIYDEPIFVLFWETIGEDLTPGQYLAEGSIVDPQRDTDELVCFDLTISEVNEFFISGFFNTVESSNTVREGEFTTLIYDCVSLGIQDEDFGEFTSGRITRSEDTLNITTYMSATTACPDIFPNEPGVFRVIVGGGKLEVDSDGDLLLEEDPSFLIHIDIRETYELNQPLQGYYYEDISAFSGSVIEYDELITFGNAITITITSDSEGFLIGSYSGMIGNRMIQGTFRSEIATNC